MRSISVFLLASTAIISTPALAQTSPAEAAEENSSAEIIVIGRGETRQVQELSNDDLGVLAAGTSPLKAIEKLPSVNFQSADPFGNYEWSTRVTIRGFNQNQLGFTLDGIPLGDMTYGNHNGLHVSRAISPENIAVTRVSQGAGSIGTQSTNNLGGTLEFQSIDPKDVLGADVGLTYGTENTMRSFVRLAGGLEDGPRAFVSAQYHKTDKWKGEGEQKTMMLNAKAIMPVGGAEVDAYVSYSDRAEQDYQDLSLAQINTLGYSWDNFGPSQYAKAILVADVGANLGATTTPLNASAGKVYPSPITSADDAYYDASGLRKDMVAALGLTASLADMVTLKVKGYYHENDGQGTWGTPYVNSPTGVPMSVRTTEYDMKRKGVFSSLNADLGDHALTAGLWFENNKFNQARRFYAYTSRTEPGRDHLKFMTNPFFTQWEFNFTTDTLQYYVQDKISLGDLTINLGWKGFQVNNESDPRIQGSLAAGKIKSQDWFQPHAGVAYKMTDKAEIFGGFTQVTRAFVSSATSGPFATTQAGFDALLARGLKPESSDTFELGARYNDNVFNGVIGVYYVNFRNRLLGVQTGAGIVGNPAILQNVGSVRSLGFEAAGDVRLGGGMTLFASYSYTGATYRENVITPTAVIATKGKEVVDTPKHLLRGEVAYDSDAFFGRVGANYMSKRYFNYLNDRSVPGRVLVDATVGYRLDAGLRAPLELQLNATNLFGKEYVSTIGSNGFGNSGDNQTLLAGSPRQVFVTLKAGF